MSAISKIIETPLGAVLMLVITLVLASLTVASAISGALNSLRKTLLNGHTAETERNPLFIAEPQFQKFGRKNLWIGHLPVCLSLSSLSR